MATAAWFFLGCFAGALTREFITAVITVARYRAVQRIEELSADAADAAVVMDAGTAGAVGP